MVSRNPQAIVSPRHAKVANLPSLAKQVRPVGAGIFLLVLVVASASCRGTAETPSRSTGAAALEPPKEVLLIASDSSVKFPKTVESEPVSITLDDKGKKTHTAFFARLNEGIRVKDLRGTRSNLAFVKEQLIARTTGTTIARLWSSEMKLESMFRFGRVRP